MFILISWNLCFLPFQNLTALARIFPSAAWLKQVSCHPHSRKLNSTVSSLGPPDGNTVHEPLAVRNPKIIMIKQETPTSSWYLTNGVVSYHSSLTAATKGKGYSLRIAPKYSSSLLCLGSFLSGRENRSDPLNGEERQGLKSTESALRNYIIQRDVCYWKTKGGFGFLHFIHVWTQNLLPSRSLPLPAGEQGLQGLWSTSSSTKVSDTQLQLLHACVEVGKNSDC